MWWRRPRLAALDEKISEDALAELVRETANLHGELRRVLLAEAGIEVCHAPVATEEYWARVRCETVGDFVCPETQKDPLELRMHAWPRVVRKERRLIHCLAVRELDPDTKRRIDVPQQISTDRTIETSIA